MEYIDEIERAVKGIEFEEFSKNHVLRIAVVKWLEIIGEAANHVTEKTKERYSNIEWYKMIGLRNIVIHEYFRIDFGIIWDAAINFLPQLKKEMLTINLD